MGTNLSYQCTQLFTRNDTQKALNSKHSLKMNDAQNEKFTQLGDFLNLFNVSDDKKVTFKNDNGDLLFVTDPRNYPRTVAGLLQYDNLVEDRLDTERINHSFLVAIQATNPRSTNKMCSLNRFDITKTRSPVSSVLFEDTFKKAKASVDAPDDLEDSLVRIICGYQPKTGTDRISLLWNLP